MKSNTPAIPMWGISQDDFQTQSSLWSAGEKHDHNTAALPKVHTLLYMLDAPVKAVVMNKISPPATLLGLFLSIWENCGIIYFPAGKRGPVSPLFHLLGHVVFPLTSAPLCPPYCLRNSHIKLWKYGLLWFMLICPQKPGLLWDSGRSTVV